MSRVRSSMTQDDDSKDPDITIDDNTAGTDDREPDLSTTDLDLDDDGDGADDGADETDTAAGGVPAWLGRHRVAAIAAVVAIVLVATGSWWWWQGRDNGVEEGVAFQIGETAVTADDVDDRVQALVALYGVEVPTEADELDTFRRDAAKSMAVQLMLDDEATARDLVVAEREVSDSLDVIVEQRYAQGGRAAFVAALGEMGATEEQVREEIRTQLLVSRLFDDVVVDVDVTEEELQAAFDERKGELGTPVRRVLRNIVVADRPTAVRVVKASRAGQMFSSLAQANSLDQATRDKGGYLGPVAASDLEPAYAEVAFATKVGDTTPPVKTQYGWNVGLVQSEIPAEAATFDAVREPLRATLLAEKSFEVWRSWLAGVIKDHDVEYADDFRPDDPFAVPDVDQVAPTPGTGP